MELLLILSMLKTAGFLVQQVLIDKEKQSYICDEEINFPNTIAYIEIAIPTILKTPYLILQSCASYKANNKTFKTQFKVNENQKCVYDIDYLYKNMYQINSNLSFLIYRTRRTILLKEITMVWMIVYPDGMKAPIKTFRNTKKELSKYFKTHKSELYNICGL